MVFLPKPTAVPFSLSANSQPLTVFHIKTTRSLASGLAWFSSKLSSLTFLLSLTTVLLVLWLSSKASSTFSHPPESQSLRIRDTEREKSNDRLPSNRSLLPQAKPNPRRCPPSILTWALAREERQSERPFSPRTQFSSCPVHWCRPAFHRPITLEVFLMYVCRGYWFSAYKHGGTVKGWNKLSEWLSIYDRLFSGKRRERKTLALSGKVVYCLKINT